MKNTRKGFTITELVIVIVVIAILAAVLIPTFASLIKKANQSADIQAARQMNTALSAETADKKPNEIKFEDVIGILEDAGYDAEGSLKPITKEHKFYWYSTYNVIILVNEAEGVEEPVVYPTNNDDVIANFSTDKAKTGDAQVLFDLEVGFRSYVRVDITDGKAATDSLSKGQSITLTEDVEFETQTVIPAGATTTLDLGGNTATTAKTGERSKYIEVNGTLVIENGIFNGRGIQVNDGGKLVIGKDANIVINAVDANGGAAVWVYAGGEVEINSGTFKATGGDKANDTVNIIYEPGVINNSGKVTINGGTFSAPNTGCYAINNYGEMVINGGNFSAYRGILACTSGTITVNDGTFAVTHDAGGWAAYTDGTGKIIINGGQFSSECGMFTGDGIKDNR